MKKLFISLFLGCLATLMYAEDTPTITLQSNQIDVERTLEFMVKTTDTKISIDWGDGNAVETDAPIIVSNPWTTSKITGTVKGTGLIKIYGPAINYLDCVSTVAGAKFTAIDLTNATELTKLYANTNAFTSLDVTPCTKLTKLYCGSNPITELTLNNPALYYINCNEIQDTSLDFSTCAALETLYCNNNNLTSFDPSQNPALKTLQLTGNQLTSIDVSSNVNLESLYVGFNQLTSLDASMCPNMRYMYCNDNQLTSLQVDKVAKRLFCKNNKLTMATLPTDIGTTSYFYAPQAPIAIAEVIKAGDAIDLSAQDNLQGLADAPQATSYTWETEDGTALVAGEHYTAANGIFTALQTPDSGVRCVISSDAFPAFSGVNALTTTYANQATITLQSDQVDVARTLEFMVKTTDTKISIDWGDGNPIETATPIIVSNPWTTSKVEGTVKGTGLIKIYGAAINYLDCVSTVAGAKFTAIDLSNATELTKLYANTNAFTSLDVTPCAKLTKLYCGSNPITELTLDNPALYYINCNEIQDTSLDFSTCAALETLYCNKNNLTSFDPSQNPTLKTLQLTSNQLTSIDVSNNVNLESLYVGFNQLTSLDASMCPKMRYMYCNDNQLTSLQVDKVAKRLFCKNNKLTMATLPTDIGTTSYFYAPQAPLAIAASIKAGESVDLSAQDNLQGLADAAQTTTYTWQVEDGTALVAGEDYTEVDGVFTFTKAQATPVHCIMASDAFPSFSGVNAFVTTAMSVAAATGITEANTEGLVLTTEGQHLTVTGATVGSLIKVYTVNGEKVATEIASEDATNFTLAAGFYVVVVDTKAYKVSIR